MGKNIMFTILTFLTALIIMAVILGGAFYLVVHNNLYGIGERYREEIQNIALLKWALPKPSDPEDPKFLSDSEIRNKYSEVKDQRDDLAKQLEEAKKEIDLLTTYKEAYESNIQQMDSEKDDIEQEMKKLEQSREEISQLIAKGDKEGFRNYFEMIDNEIAAKIYEDIIYEEKIGQDTKKFLQIYDDMDEAAAARIFEEMGEKKLDLVTEILSGMKKENISGILAEMKPSFASKVIEKMAEELKISERR